MMSGLDKSEDINASGNQVANPSETTTQEALYNLNSFVLSHLEYTPNVTDDGRCNQCGGQVTRIRAYEPGGSKRVVCPTCLDDLRIDLIHQLSPQVAANDLPTDSSKPASGELEANREATPDE